MTVPLEWQVKAVRRAAERMANSAWFHERRGDDQSKTARAEANALDAAALTLEAMAIEGRLGGKKVANGRR